MEIIIKQKSTKRGTANQELYNKVMAALDNMKPNSDECIQIHANEIDGSPKSFPNNIKVYLKLHWPHDKNHSYQFKVEKVDGQITKIWMWLLK